jgi:hypothetical protein
MSSENSTGTLDSLYLDIAGITSMRTQREVQAAEDLERIAAQMNKDVGAVTKDEWANLQNALVKVYLRLR